MCDRVFLKMYSRYRAHLIEQHKFYYDEARKRLLSQFSDIEGEADNYMKDEAKKLEQYFNPETHDPSDFYDHVFDNALHHYELLSDMKQQVILSTVAGMYHHWDKELRDWLAREIRHTFTNKEVENAIWKENSSSLLGLFECIGWNVLDQSFYSSIDAARLVVNVFKHGEGNSLKSLKENFPEFLDEDEFFLDMKYLNYTHLKVSEKDVGFFYKGIKEFWEQVPENIFVSEEVAIPNWLHKALNK